ncbi:Prenylated Rab acceptor protein 1 [Rhodotorula kratochvilovae]
MLYSTLFTSLAAVSAVQAAPFFASSPKTLTKRAEQKTWEGHVADVQIHESCSPSQTAYLRNGLDEMKRIAEHAHDRILTLGEEDPLYIKYFGTASSAAASGLYAQIVWGSKPGVLLRCDNPDGNCEQTTAAGPWAGHWRGKNATEETVICAPTYTDRLHLSSLCWDGNEIGVASNSQWLATDLLHRMMHIPSITYNKVEHAADTYPGVLELAASNNSAAAYNQATFQLYAIDAYAQDVAYPPNGCVGAEAHIPTEEDSHDHGAATSSTAAASATVPAEVTVGAASATSSAAESCHTHADGEVHCA